MVDYEVSAIEIAIVESETPVDYFLRLFSSIWSSEFLFPSFISTRTHSTWQISKVKVEVIRTSLGAKGARDCANA